MRGERWFSAAAVAAVLAGCGSPGSSSDRTVTVVVSATAPSLPVAVSVRPVPGRADETSCARRAAPIPSVDPSASFDINDPQQRARRALAEQFRPTPRRGAVPAAAVPGAEACVQALRQVFSLLTAGIRGTPSESEIDIALRSAGLTRIVVRPGPAFTASTGAACLYGTFSADEPAFTIGPTAADGSCRL